jgi:NitT/TauT family transport system substrate-binding protein
MRSRFAVPFPSRYPRAFAGLFVLLWLLAGCSPWSGDSAWLRIGTNVWPGYEPLYLARDLGYFDQTPVKLVEYPSASEVIRAFRNGAIEGAALTLDEVLLLEQSGLEPRVVLVMDVSHGGDVIIGRPGTGGMPGLKGRRVGVEDTALGAYVLSRALQLHGMQPSEIQIVPLEASGHEQAFRAGDIDAVVTFEPMRSNLLAANAELLFDSTLIPGEVVDVLAIRRDYLERHPKTVQMLVQKWFDTLAYQVRNPDEAARRISKRLGIRPDEFMESLAGLKIPGRAETRQMLAGSTPSLAESAERLRDTMRAYGLLDRDIQLTGIIDGSHL